MTAKRKRTKCGWAPIADHKGNDNAWCIVRDTSDGEPYPARWCGHRWEDPYSDQPGIISPTEFYILPKG